VTVGVCGLCSAQFKSYLPNPDKAMWEVKAWFYGHCCMDAGTPEKQAA